MTGKPAPVVFISFRCLARACLDPLSSRGEALIGDALTRSGSIGGGSFECRLLYGPPGLGFDQFFAGTSGRPGPHIVTLHLLYPTVYAIISSSSLTKTVLF